ncbi:MAG: DUF3558 domain-containing protein [Actinomycetota bacterium]|nr:DUF3558 domain-containing protein [Actinomycetota bacterium]
MRRCGIAGVVLVVAAGLSVACGDGDGQGAGPSTTVVTPSPSTGPTTTASSRVLPRRLKELDLTNVDPCKSLTMAQLRELDYDWGYGRAPGRDTSNIHGGKICNFNSAARSIGARVGFATTEDAEVWVTDPSRNKTNPTTPTEVAGFPALRMTNDRKEQSCDYLLDVHDGQYIQVRGEMDLSRGPAGTEPYCVEAKRVAEMIVQTLSSGSNS